MVKAFVFLSLERWRKLSTPFKITALHIRAGYTRKQIAYKLDLNQNTLDSRIAKIEKVFDVADLNDLCQILNLIEFDERELRFLHPDPLTDRE